MEATDVKTILAVDDQPNILDLISISLASEDRTILLAENGEKAVEIAFAKDPDLIILDLIMPGEMNGFEVLKILRSDQRTQECPILVLTAWNQEKIREQVSEMGANDYLAKPFTLSDLQEKVEDLTH